MPNSVVLRMACADSFPMHSWLASRQSWKPQ